MNSKNKNEKKKIRWKNKNKNFLNNKTYRKEIIDNSPEYIKPNKKESYMKEKSKKTEEIFEIQGYYYDKEKNRYFALNQAETIQFKNIESSIQKRAFKKIKTILSNFNIIHSCKIKEKQILKQYYSRVNSLKESNFVNIEYEGDKLPNSKYIFYLNKYLLKFDYFSPGNDINNSSNNFINIIVHDLISNKFIKKLVIEEYYNDFDIKEDNLILIDNITKLSIINNIKEIIESNNTKIYINIINKFKLRINNIGRISMVYKWPFININNKFTYYYLVWNNFYYFDTINNNDKLIITNSDIIYLSKSLLIKNKSNIKINKVNIDNKNQYINFFISNNDNKSPEFYFFSVKGEIHCYRINKNNLFKLNRIITNGILYDVQIIDTIPFKNENNFLMISNEKIIFNFNLSNQTMTKIIFNENDENKNIKYKMKIFKYIEENNCLIFDDDNYIKVLSLDDFSIIKKFFYDNYKYNILIINNNDYILV